MLAGLKSTSTGGLSGSLHKFDQALEPLSTSLGLGVAATWQIALDEATTSTIRQPEARHRDHSSSATCRPSSRCASTSRLWDDAAALADIWMQKFKASSADELKVVMEREERYRMECAVFDATRRVIKMQRAWRCYALRTRTGAATTRSPASTRSTSTRASGGSRTCRSRSTSTARRIVPDADGTNGGLTAGRGGEETVGLWHAHSQSRIFSKARG